MWVTKLLIFPVEIRIFCPKTTKFGPKLAFLVNLGQAMQAYSVPSLVAGAWTEREKMYHGGSFLKLADDNMDIQNPEAQNRELSGF